MQADILAMLSGVGSWTLRTALILFVLLFMPTPMAQY